ncbi:MAG: hypothetical protein Q8L89_03630 [Gammaproteobacteria bacterium]|nr:hypothetical protein [Gammaproteobacteria bacterium]
MNDFAPWLATLIAAFAGAWFAFYLQDKKECRKERNQRVSSINQALFTLARQYRALCNMKEDLDAFKDDNLRFVNAPALTTNDSQDIRVKIDNLHFLLESSNPNLLMEVTLEQERFEMALKAIQLRSDFHIGELQPVFVSLGIKNGVPISLDEISQKLGPRLVGTLRNQTDQMYSNVYESCGSTLDVLNKLRTFAKQTFPKDKFIGVASAS